MSSLAESLRHLDDEYGNFDVTSPGNLGRPKPPPEQRSPELRKRQVIRVLFNCCNVYAALPIPDRVAQEQLSSWRFHCPRCGGLIEIPI